MRAKTAFLLILGFVIVCLVPTVLYLIADHNSAGVDAWRQSETPADRPDRPTPVAPNRGSEVLDGFRGNVHPLLFGETRLEVTAHWTSVGPGRDKMHTRLNPTVYAWFKELRPNEPQRTYTHSDFSAFLPETVGKVGQLWALDADKIARILSQFHPHPSMQLIASGRRAGPDGAFGILRAVSPDYLDIGFRIHAEFELTPDDWRDHRPRVRAWYTPAYFSGRVLVNRRTGAVDHFQLGLPTDKALNVHLTFALKDVGVNRQSHDVVRVEHMELSGGDSGLAQNIPWTEALSPTDADRRLAKVFYKFQEIDWIPFDQVATKASSQGRPIFAFVSWGALDDQSC